MPVANSIWDQENWPLAIGNIVVYTGSGAPTSLTLPTNITFVVGNFYWDTAGKALYVCDTGGDNTTSHWTGPI